MILLIGLCLYLVAATIYNIVKDDPTFNENILIIIGITTIGGFAMMVVSIVMTLHSKGILKFIINFMLNNFV